MQPGNQRTRDLGPGDRSLHDGHAQRLRQQQQLHIKAPALQALARVQPPCRCPREELPPQAALGSGYYETLSLCPYHVRK